MMRDLRRASVAERSIELGLKRVVDVMGASIGLLLLSPVLVAVAIGIRCTGRGPVLFRHERVGLGGRRFSVWKFRTMCPGTQEEVLGDPAQRAEYVTNGWKLLPDDPRITPLGRVLRRSSIDELPQLANVLAGDMSLVGVRPLVPDELAARPASDQEAYTSMRPGMTGRWQVEGRSNLDEIDRLQLDREYVERWSLWSDLALLVRTPVAVLRVNRSR
jgi:lipopolysaccharide/colanic/teichoic acid biosynthesis glycosyltransferase